MDAPRRPRHLRRHHVLHGVRLGPAPTPAAGHVDVGDESFDATRRHLRHRRDFASTAEDTRRALVDATEALRRGIGIRNIGAWVESAEKRLGDASSSMTSVAARTFATSSAGRRRQRGRVGRTLDDAVGAMRHAVHGLNTTPSRR